MRASDGDCASTSGSGGGGGAGNGGAGSRPGSAMAGGMSGLRSARLMENRLEKAVLKANEAASIRHTYKQVCGQRGG